MDKLDRADVPHHGEAKLRFDTKWERRSVQNRQRTPLNGLWTHTKRGLYHDGRFATLADVVNHYDSCFSLGLTAQEQRDVVEYMKSLRRRK